MELYGQAQTFAFTLLTGAFLGILFDFYRVVRSLLVRPRGAITAIGDLLYWLVATAVVLLSLLLCNWLELRFYVFLGLVSGALAYYRMLSRYTIYLLIRVLWALGWLMGWVRKIIAYAILRPVTFVLHLLILPFVKARKPPPPAE